MKIQDCMISDQAYTLLDGLGQHEVGLHLAVERKLKAIGDPEITSRTESGETGFFRALFGKRRDLLVIQNSRFSEYAVLIAAKPHGTALHVAWMVLVEPRLARDVRRALRIDAEPGSRFEVGAELDAIDLMDLRGFLAVTRLSLKHAIRELTDQESEEDDLYVDSTKA
jgi:hypothetical protein